jgi:hypothetical protein
MQNMWLLQQGFAHVQPDDDTPRISGHGTSASNLAQLGNTLFPFVLVEPESKNKSPQRGFWTLSICGDPYSREEGEDR